MLAKLSLVFLARTSHELRTPMIHSYFEATVRFFLSEIANNREALVSLDLFLASDYLERAVKCFLRRLYSCRRFFSAFARSTYFFFCPADMRPHNLPAARATTVTGCFGFLQRNLRKKMMNGLVALTPTR